MRRILLATIVIVVLAQNAAANGFEIMGNVSSNYGYPVYGVNVTAYNATDNAYLNSSYTNETGWFKMNVPLSSPQYTIKLVSKKSEYNDNTTYLYINANNDPSYVPPKIVLNAKFSLNDKITEMIYNGSTIPFNTTYHTFYYFYNYSLTNSNITVNVTINNTNNVLPPMGYYNYTLWANFSEVLTADPNNVVYNTSQTNKSGYYVFTFECSVYNQPVNTTQQGGNVWLYMNITNNAGYQWSQNGGTLIGGVFAVLNVNPKYTIPGLNNTNTTDWSTINDFSHVTNLKFEHNSSYGIDGMLEILEPVNLLDLNFVTNLQNLGTNLEMASRNMSIKQANTAMREFNKSSRIIFYNLSVNVLRINVTPEGSNQPIVIYNPLNDYCNDAYLDCGNVSIGQMLNGNYSVNFTVNHWTTYEVNELYPVVNLNTSERFASIQAAINAENTTDGNIIRLDPGIYHENVDVNKSVTVQGAGKDVSIIDAGGGSYAIYVEADGVTIKDLTVRNATDKSSSCIQIGTSSHTTVENVNVSANFVGVSINAIQPQSYNTIRNCEIKNNTVGVYINYGDNETISNNLILNNSNNGIEIRNSRDILVSRNTISNDGHGIWISSSYNTTILNNTISNNNLSEDSGIHLTSLTYDTEIHLNTITNNGGGGSYGLYNENATDVADATLNWWGSDSGPYNATTNPNGEGDSIYGNISFEPWLLAAPSSGDYVTTQSGTDTIDHSSDLGVWIQKDGTGTPEIGISRYESNPGASFSNDLGLYYDVYLDSTNGVNSLTIRFYYSDSDVSGKDESKLAIYWYNGNSWVKCSNQHVNAAQNYVEVYIDSSTTPSLSDLTGTPFAASAPVYTQQSTTTGGATGSAGGGGYVVYLTPEPTRSPTPFPTQTPTPILTATPTPTATEIPKTPVVQTSPTPKTTKATPTSTPKKTPGFEVLLATIGLLLAMYLIRRY